MAEYAVAEFDDKEVQDFIKKLQKKISDIKGGSVVFQSILNATIFKDVDDHYKKTSGPDGPWQSWSPGYALHMSKLGKSGNNILQDTGRLRQGIMPGRSSSEFIEWINPVEYASTHNYGDPSRNIPAREFMYLSDLAMEEISEKTLAFILEEQA